jgi:hypothetical protein
LLVCRNKLLTVGSGVTNLADEAFSGCLDLTAVYFQGNAPSLGAYVFYEVYGATVYYLPGTTGWGETFGGLPVRPWSTPAPAAPTGVAVSNGAAPNYKVQVAWAAASGATYYQVFRHTANDSAGAVQIGTTFATDYDDNWAEIGPTYYYWVKAVNGAGASAFSAAASGIINGEALLITANGLVGEVFLNTGEAVTVAVAMWNMERFFGNEVDWWVVAFAHSGQWYYLDSARQWTPFTGDLELCRPVAQGYVCNFPATTVLDRYQLPRGIYDFWFAIDYPMDGVLDQYGQIAFDKVTVIVQ